ncbi:MAG TPA: hypothetical protein VFH78_14495, partial [Candidatus Thermoplasmatota archaeon]|nr:hypothetical protein [Candidatus Thermoplasmatota archaeon]
LALRASERVLHKAREQGLWDVGEEVARHAEPLLREGARSVAWPEALEWSRGVLAWSIRAGEEATRRRVLRLWAGVVLDLRRDGSIAQSAALARVVEQAAAEAGAGELAREMLEA